MPKRDLLAFHVAAGEAERREGVVAVRLGPVGRRDARDEQDCHRGKDGPTLALVADHAAEHVGERGADREDRDHLDKVRQRGGIFERVRRVGVEKAAAIGAEHLDRDLRGDRAHRNGLLAAFERGRVHVRAERLRHALPDQEQCVDDAHRQQDVERAPRDIDPEIPHGPRRCPREAADQRDREHDTGGRRQKVLVGQAEHLHEVGHRAFAAVVLPVGVGDEAHRRIEGEVGGHGRLAGRIEGQRGLQAHQSVENQKAGDVKEQHRHRIGDPVLLARLVDPADPVKTRLDRTQNRREKCALAVEHSRHVAAERHHECGDDGAEQQNLNPADDGHGG